MFDLPYLSCYNSSGCDRSGHIALAAMAVTAANLAVLEVAAILVAVTMCARIRNTFLSIVLLLIRKIFL